MLLRFLTRISTINNAIILNLLLTNQAKPGILPIKPVIIWLNPFTLPTELVKF